LQLYQTSVPHPKLKITIIHYKKPLYLIFPTCEASPHYLLCPLY